MTDPATERRLTPGRPDEDGERLGGDAACWAHRVCDACGRLNSDEHPVVCEACGEPFDRG